jgi:hypothetical protein
MVRAMRIVALAVCASLLAGCETKRGCRTTMQVGGATAAIGLPFVLITRNEGESSAAYQVSAGVFAAGLLLVAAGLVGEIWIGANTKP